MLKKTKGEELFYKEVADIVSQSRGDVHFVGEDVAPYRVSVEPVPKNVAKQDAAFFSEIARILAASRSNVYRAINSAMVETYWKIGRRIVEQEQNGKGRADYGDYLITNLSRYLGDTLGRGFSEANLKNMRQFYVVFPEFEQFRRQCLGNSNQFARQCLANSSNGKFSTQRVENLPWSHICTIMRLDDEDERNYYLREATSENWSFRQLERNIRTGYYRRLLSTQRKQKSQKTSAPKIHDITDFVRDPVYAEYLAFPENWRGKESQLEQALVDNMQKFLMVLGKGFSFVARQLRISTETDHFYVDLVFYNYLLKCFVLIDLKTSRLAHADIGQMDMYVRMFDALKRGPDDNPTVGIILCTDKSETMVKYSILKENKQIFTSKYKTVLPSENELADMLARENTRLLEARPKLLRGKKMGVAN